jgi:hypothetical protein
LQDLMAHVSSDSTRAYYDISTARRRDAVAVMRRFRFDRNGVRVDTAQEELLDLEYQRAGLAGVAVPLGECSHPPMLKPGDGRCPVRFRCLGCSQFSSSVDRLPELRAYLDELLASRESILAGDLLDEWAKEDALPHQEEIDQIRALVVRAEAILGELDEAEREQVTGAVTVYRAMRDTMLERRAVVPVSLRLRVDGPVVIG